MNKRFFLKSVSLAAIALGIALPASAQQWKPTKPINLIVPWAAGGSTDQVTRVTAAEIEKVLGQKIVIVNQPGASGSIGTKSAWTRPRTATPGPPAPRRTWAPTRRWACWTCRPADWHLFLTVANVPVVGVNAGKP